MKIVRLELRVEETTKDFVVEVYKKHNLPSKNKAFDLIVRNYARMEKEFKEMKEQNLKHQQQERKAKNELAKFKEIYSSLIAFMDDFKINMNQKVEEFKEVISLQKS